LQGGQKILPEKEQHHRQGEKNSGADADLQSHGHRVGDLQRQEGVGMREREIFLSLLEGPTDCLHHLPDSQNARHRPDPDGGGTFQDDPTKILDMFEERLFLIVHVNFLQPHSVTTPGRGISWGSWGISGSSCTE
jgi:hypothetical protein